MQLQLRFKSDHHNMYTEEVNKIVLNSSDNKRLQTFDRVTAYPYGTNAFKVCKSEMLSKICCNVYMINFDDIVNENKTAHKNWPYITGQSSIQNINNRRFRIRKNKCIIKLNRKTTRH